MEGIATYARQLQAILNKTLDMEAQLERIASTVDFTTEDWQYMYKNHRRLANELSALVYEYGPE